ncbi:hypothetical protein EAI62_26360, partial [Escherichia coli]
TGNQSECDSPKKILVRFNGGSFSFLMKRGGGSTCEKKRVAMDLHRLCSGLSLILSGFFLKCHRRFPAEC